jgi:hypothetical protein
MQVQGLSGYLITESDEGYRRGRKREKASAGDTFSCTKEISGA